jgi:hypothetical protein
MVTCLNAGIRRVVILIPSLLLLLSGAQARADYATADQDWVTVKDVSLSIKPGSPLDFSRWVAAGPAGQHGHVVASTAGRMVFEENGESPRFTCSSVFRSPYPGGFPPKDQADFYAQQLRLHGYNLARFHYVDAKLMSDLDGKSLKTPDFGFNPEQLDRWLYFTAALKKQGIYWVMDAMSSANGAMGGVFPDRFAGKYHFDAGVYFDPAAQAHWKRLVDRLLATKNPYTKISPIDDPALVGIVLFNENQLSFLAQMRSDWPPAGLVQRYNEWLKQHYGSTGALAAAWGDLSPAESLDSGNIPWPRDMNRASPRTLDAQHFMADIESSTAAWMTQYLRDRGYKGLVTSYNGPVVPATIVSKRALPWIDNHAYLDGNDNFKPGATIGQTSAVTWAVPHMRNPAFQRMAGKPYSLTEFGQPFWNKYRFESGVEVPAMAGLQDWDFTCLHGSGDVDYSMQETAFFKQFLFPSVGGLDPVIRATETLSTLLIRRGEVQPSRNTIRYDLTQGGAFGLVAPHTNITSLAWLGRVDAELGNGAPAGAPSPVLVVKPSYLPGGGGGAAADQASRQELQKYVGVLRERGVLPPQNQTDIAAGVYQSDTGQIVLDQRRGQLRLVTPKTEAIAFINPGRGMGLRVLQVNNASVEGLLAASALDDQPLADSKRILIIFATDAENTGMRFTSPDRKTLVTLGKLPVRIRHGVANISLTLAGSGAYTLHAIHLNGDVGDALPVTSEANGVRMVLDNAALAQGPTTFFLLERN